MFGTDMQGVRAKWRWAGALAGVLALGAPSASAAERPAVIELFTSQGCSSCPPADALMGQLARERRDIIILSFPVDIWDYIGWKDTLAKPEFTARQRHYSQTRGDHQVYTPQAVVDGAAHAVGSDKQHLLALVDELEPARKALGASLRITERDGMLIADLDAGDPGAGSGDVARGAGVWLLRVVRARTIAIGRGENDGRRVTYTNVVRSMVRMGHWMGAAARFEMPLAEARGDDGEGYVVIVQKNMGEVLGPVLAAARSGNL